MCGFVSDTNDDDKLMIQPPLMGRLEDENSVGLPTSVTGVVFRCLNAETKM